MRAFFKPNRFAIHGAENQNLCFHARPQCTTLRIRVCTMQQYLQYYFQVYLRRFWSSIAYSVEHMSLTHWMILGSLSVIAGIVMLRSTKR